MAATTAPKVLRTTNDSLGQYLQEMGRVPLLTADEEIELGRLVQAGLVAEAALADGDVPAEERVRLRRQVRHGRDAMERFITANLRLVVSVVRRYQGFSSLTLADLIQEGNIGLMRAVEKFDPNRGFRFSTYATYWIRQSVSRAIDATGSVIRLPGDFAQQSRAVRTAHEEFERAEGRAPTVEEIAGLTGLSEAAVQRILTVPQVHQSLDAPASSDQGDGNLTITPVADDDPEADVVRTVMGERLIECLHELPERYRHVLVLRYGLPDGRRRTLDEIAKVFGVTRERIRQIESKALLRLQRAAELHDSVEALAG